MELIHHWISAYGYAGIVVLLMLGIVGLPVPDETLLAFAGYLVFRRRLDMELTIISAFAGTICGISVSYLIGKASGILLLHRYGRYFSVTPERLRKATDWFTKIGKWTLPIGYFVPGVRHVTAYIAGAAELPYPIFALFAYCGGVVWSLTFILSGYFLGSKWDKVLSNVEDHILIGIGALVLLQFIFWFFKRKTKKFANSSK
jgi:membrane protein DedA with SNARE-associated domain